MAIGTSQEMSTGIEIILRVPNGADPRGISQNAVIRLNAMTAERGHAQGQLRVRPALGTSLNAVLILRVFRGQRSSHGPGTVVRKVQRLIWKPLMTVPIRDYQDCDDQSPF